jgi:hypothetical protein
MRLGCEVSETGRVMLGTKKESTVFESGRSLFLQMPSQHTNPLAMPLYEERRAVLVLHEKGTSEQL